MIILLLSVETIDSVVVTLDVTWRRENENKYRPTQATITQIRPEMITQFRVECIVRRILECWNDIRSKMNMRILLVRIACKVWMGWIVVPFGFSLALALSKKSHSSRLYSDFGDSLVHFQQVTRNGFAENDRYSKSNTMKNWIWRCIEIPPIHTIEGASFSISNWLFEPYKNVLHNAKIIQPTNIETVSLAHCAKFKANQMILEIERFSILKMNQRLRSTANVLNVSAICVCVETPYDIHFKLFRSINLGELLLLLHRFILKTTEDMCAHFARRISFW